MALGESRYAVVRVIGAASGGPGGGVLRCLRVMKKYLQRMLTITVMGLVGATAGCASQPDVRAVWRMPGVAPVGNAADTRAPGYRWAYTAGEGHREARGASSAGRGDLPDSIRPPSDALWHGDEGTAMRRARKLSLPLFIDFYADWCEPCLRMANDTFLDADVRTQLRQQTVPLQIDVTEESTINREQLERYKVNKLPTMLLVSAAGEELARYERYVSAAELSARLTPPPTAASDNQHGAPQAPATAAATNGAKPWCAPELETLPGDVCYASDPKQLPRRTLVVFLHGWVQHGMGWQYAQQRAIVRGAGRLGFSVLTPRGRTGASKKGGANIVSWPTGMEAQKKYEQALLDEWRSAQATIEQRQGAPFDEVFVVGFSNGAYYASSLAMRGRLKVAGYAMFAGGSAYPPSAAKDMRAPVFLGICSKDNTATAARRLRDQLRRSGWPHRAETRTVGHTMADRHLDHALNYLRKQHGASGR
ncbi:MAG TPA: DUF255 domain-containing protein [Sorangium sp.]|nr:DUF255 domain-containing protein [Sorangium sp.]